MSDKNLVNSYFGTVKEANICQSTWHFGDFIFKGKFSFQENNLSKWIKVISRIPSEWTQVIQSNREGLYILVEIPYQGTKVI